VSTDYSGYRKPMTGMWQALEKEIVDVDSTISKEKSIYVGDAAGRVKYGSKKRDHSCVDRLFAQNIGIKFVYPELEFQGITDNRRFECGKIDPEKFFPASTEQAEQICAVNLKDYTEGRPQEMIINVGFQASGKSNFARRVFEPHGYQIISNDALGSEAKSKREAALQLSRGLSVVIDNTNMSRAHRKRFIDIAVAAHSKVRIFHFTAPMELCKDHLNYYRAQISLGTRYQRNVIPDVAFYSARKVFEQPSKSENPIIEDIIEIPLLPPVDHREYFFHYT